MQQYNKQESIFAKMIRKIILFLFLIGATLCALSFLLDGCKTEKHQNSSALLNNTPKYVGSVTCKSCHSKEYNDWQTSHHFKAMMAANDSTIAGDFNNSTFIANGITSHFFKRDKKFFINTQGDDGLNHDYQVLYTFGVEPLQQYVIAFPGGKFQITRQCWDTEKKKWFHQYPDQKIPHNDWLHWTGNGQNWNTMCAYCHSTNVQKNYSVDSDSYHTTFNEPMVSCESCHGGASNHVAIMQSDDYLKKHQLPDGKTGILHRGDSANVITTCAPCHSRRTEIFPVVASENLFDNFIPQIISNEFYHADGQINEEDFEYSSFAQSKMFAHGVVCTNCHQPHSGKFKAEGNKLCLQCHAPKYDTEQHHFHKMNTEASQCVNCHAPSKVYMGNDLRRDHSFRIPRPDQSVTYGTPNACNSCHKDKTAQWAATKVSSFYGKERLYHFSDDLIPGSLNNPESESHLIKLLSDTSQPEIARATAAYYLGNIITNPSADALLNSLKDKKSLVRYNAVRSLNGFPAQFWKEAVGNLLNDPVRPVRIAAADLYMTLPVAEIDANKKSAFENAQNENYQFISNQADFAVGNIALADYYAAKQDHNNAIKFYNRALKKDSLLNPARLNLSSSLNALGKNDEAFRVLKEASIIEPGNDRIFYNLALLYYEMKDEKNATGCFEKCLSLKTNNSHVFYNYGLLKQHEGQAAMAEILFLRGLAIEPQSLEINYALAILYLQQNQQEKGKQRIELLKRLAPNEPSFQKLFNAI
ncbi:MAG: multiheme c-type cytochrome [Bacteroidia bacterium]